MSSLFSPQGADSGTILSSVNGQYYLQVRLDSVKKCGVLLAIHSSSSFGNLTSSHRWNITEGITIALGGLWGGVEMPCPALHSLPSLRSAPPYELTPLLAFPPPPYTINKGDPVPLHLPAIRADLARHLVRHPI